MGGKCEPDGALGLRLRSLFKAIRLRSQQSLSQLMFYSIMHVYAHGQQFGSLWWYRWYGRGDASASISVSDFVVNCIGCASKEHMYATVSFCVDRILSIAVGPETVCWISPERKSFLCLLQLNKCL